jgi:ABC-type phosphate transport system substrate-binding protein
VARAKPEPRAKAKAKRLVPAAIVAVFLVTAGWLALTRAPAGGPARTLTVATTDTLAPLSEELAADFRRAHPEVVVLVDRFPAAEGARAEAASGRADVVVLTGPGGQLIGHRALALAISPSVALRSISTADLARIYSQRATLWSDVANLPQTPITPVDRAATDPDHQVFVTSVIGQAQDPVNNSLVVPDDAAAAAALARAGTIAYLGLRSAPAQDLVSLDGVGCSPESVRSGAWKLVEEVRAQVVGGSGSRYPSDFVTYARSKAGQAVVDRHEVSL